MALLVRETWAGLQDGGQIVSGSLSKMWMFLNQCLRQQNGLKQNLQPLRERRGNTAF